MDSAAAAPRISYLSNPNVCGARLRSSELTWSPESKAFVTEASTHGGQLFRQLFADALDVGFVLISAKSEDEALFALDEAATSRSAEQEIISWSFAPTEESIRRQPALRGVRVLCFNT